MVYVDRNMLEILTVIKYLLVYFNNKTLCNKLDIQNNTNPLFYISFFFAHIGFNAHFQFTLLK